MKIRLLNEETFTKYASRHVLRSYFQTDEYASYCRSKGFTYEYVALVDNDDNIHAASLILFKNIGKFYRYGYSPKGFLLNYYDQKLFELFTKELLAYYKKKNIAFIKINPEIVVATLDKVSKAFKQTSNNNLKSYFDKLNFVYLNSNKEFGHILPKYNAIVPLNNFDFTKLNSSLKNKIRKAETIGLSLVKAEEYQFDILYNFLKGMNIRTYEDYKAYYKVFSKKEMIDTFLIKVDYELCLENTKNLYEKELDNNSRLLAKLIKINNENNLKKKIKSDHLLEVYKDDIIRYTKLLAMAKTDYVAGAITIKYQNRIYIIASGYNVDLKKLGANHYLYYQLCEYYKSNFDFIELNGISGDFNKDHKFNGLNRFKLGYNPICVEYIGEFDLIINPGVYKGLVKNGTLNKEFEK